MCSALPDDDVVDLAFAPVHRDAQPGGCFVQRRTAGSVMMKAWLV